MFIDLSRLPPPNYVAGLSVKAGDEIATAYERLRAFIARNQPDACDEASIDIDMVGGVQIVTRMPATPYIPFKIGIGVVDSKIRAYIGMGRINGKAFWPEPIKEGTKTLELFPCTNTINANHGAIEATGQGEGGSGGDSGVFVGFTAKVNATGKIDLSGKIEILALPLQKKEDTCYYMLGYIDENGKLFQIIRSNLRVDAIRKSGVGVQPIFIFASQI